MANQPTIETTWTVTPETPKWRLQTIRILQLLGILSGFLGGADFLQLLVLMPPDVSKWLLVAGPAFAAGSKPLLMLLGDYLDDGVKNDSFKVGMLFPPFLALMCLGFTGCAGVSVQSPYGEFSSAKDGSVLYTPPARPIIIPIHTTK
jgi:hypothetical protein